MLWPSSYSVMIQPVRASLAMAGAWSRASAWEMHPGRSGVDDDVAAVGVRMGEERVIGVQVVLERLAAVGVSQLLFSF